MVYLGRPSTGCRNCRQRHIKCDETRPHCTACTRTGRTCPGYLHPFDVMLRDQTATFIKVPTTASLPAASHKSSLSKNADESSRGGSKALSLSPTQSAPLPVSWSRNSLPADLYQPMEDTVLPLFFNSYLYLPKDPHIRNGFMEILPGMFSNARVGSHLHTSTLAVAFFTVAAWAGQGSLLRASETYFTRALPKIREALMKDEDTDFESVLISILLLSTYEEFVAIKDWGNPMKAHLRGAVALINSKMPKTLKGPSSSTICNAVQTQIIKTTRGLGNPMVPTPKVWPLLQPTTPPSPRLFLSSTASQLVQLRHDWENTRLHANNETEVKAILERAMEIDLALASWTYWVPAHWVPEAATIIPQSVRNAGLYRNRCDCYVDMWIASTWNSYRDCRMLVQSIIVSCMRMIPSGDPNGGRLAAATAVIRKLADDICATVPYFLGSQMGSVRLKPGLVDYPYAETRPVTLTHKQSAPLMGAWHIIPYLRNLQGPELGLPPEQVNWVERQMDRVLTIYFQR